MYVYRCWFFLEYVKHCKKKKEKNMGILRGTNKDHDEVKTKGIAKENDSPEKRNVFFFSKICKLQRNL
jgi:hypothetical protein